MKNAKTVRLDPAVDKIWVAQMYCLPISPAKKTTYTLYAGDGAGKEVSEQVTVDLLGQPDKKCCQAPNGLILAFTASAEKVHPGEPVTLCYGVDAAARSVGISPPVQTLIPSRRLCFTTKIAKTTEFTLTATDEGNGRSQASLRVEVE